LVSPTASAYSRTFFTPHRVEQRRVRFADLVGRNWHGAAVLHTSPAKCEAKLHLATEQRRKHEPSLGDTAPDFEARPLRARSSSTTGSATRGPFSSPTPRASRRSARPSSATWHASQPEFDRRGVKIIGLSVDTVDENEGWAKDIEKTQGFAPTTRSSPTTTSRSPRPTECWPHRRGRLRRPHPR